MRNYLRWLYSHLIQWSTSEILPDNLIRSTVILAPHQDDETLGCGGSVIKKKVAGAEVRIIFMTDGTLSHKDLLPSAELKKIRDEEALAACQVLGLEESDIFFLGFKDGRLHEYIDIAVIKVVEILRKYKPQEIFIPYQKEAPSDHNATYRIAMSALEKWGKQVIIYEYLVWAWYHWPWVGVFQTSRKATREILKNTVFSIASLRLVKDLSHAVCIADVLDRKRAALDQHKSQMTRLISDRHWLILSDVSKGEFLIQFFQDYEYFRVCEFPGNGEKSSSTKVSVR
jgi:LmbE family N-acetylglucosaminyl deacetylase